MTTEDVQLALDQVAALNRAQAISLVASTLPAGVVLLDLDRLSQRKVLTEYAQLQDIDVDDAILELLGSILAYPRGVDLVAGVLTKARSRAHGIKPPTRPSGRAQ